MSMGMGLLILERRERGIERREKERENALRFDRQRQRNNGCSRW